MKQITVSLSSAMLLEEGIQKIKKEWDKGIYTSLLIHIFSGIEEEDVVLAVVSRFTMMFPGIPIVGTLSAGEIVEGKIPEKGFAASALFFRSSSVTVLRRDGVKGNEAKTGAHLAEEANAIPDLKALELLMPGTEFNTGVFLGELEKVNHGVAVYGGYSGGHRLDQSEHFIFDQNGIDHDSVYAIAYSGKDFHIQVDKSAGWQRLGTPFKVTNAIENQLVEIDGKPAVEVYEKYLQINRDDNFAEETFEFPLVAYKDGEELLRHTITVGENGTLFLAGFVEKDMDIYLSYGNPKDIVNRVNHRLLEVGQFNPEAILLFSCSVRKAFWENFAEIELLPFEEIASTSGFYTWGEVKRNPKTDRLYEYNITMLSVAMREGDAEPLDRQFKVDDSVLKGQASLLKRLSKLVAATTEELQKAYLDLSLLNDKLKIMAEYDALTGMYNRRMIEEKIAAHMKNAKESGKQLGMIMLDIDHFKEVNDSYGHGIGDEVLSILGKICIKAVKDRGGNLGRWGGEEFFIVLPDHTLEEMMAFAEELREKVENAEFPCIDRLTISLGVHMAEPDEDLRISYKMTDDALYAAKQGGRNMTKTCDH